MTDKPIDHKRELTEGAEFSTDSAATDEPGYSVDEIRADLPFATTEELYVFLCHANIEILRRFLVAYDSGEDVSFYIKTFRKSVELDQLK